MGWGCGQFLVLHGVLAYALCGLPGDFLPVYGNLTAKMGCF